jgi:hypothetical protein
MPVAWSERDLAEIEEIKRLKARYCHLMDRQRWSEWGELYLPDAVLSPGEGLGTYTGGEEIAAFVERSLNGIKTCHIGLRPTSS